MTPEQQARINIDKMLQSAGWIIQNMKDINLSAGIGVAVREYPTDTGPADYVLFVNRSPFGVIEAKKEGTILTSDRVEDQPERYSVSYLKYMQEAKDLPFLYQSTGKETRFCDQRDPNPRYREIFSFHQPQTLLEICNETKTLRGRLKELPCLDPEGLRICQKNAIENLEESFAMAKPRALIQMATGSGKTYTAITSIYRLLKFAGAKRILFLVDTRNLGEQAEQEFQAYTPVDDQRKFTELYTVQRLSSSFIDKDAKVCISTIQRMYSILRGEELDESTELVSPNELVWQNQRSKEVVYNSKYPCEFFDFIIIDECHRSIYNLWRQVLEYFDAFMIGLTATPDNRTYGFFNENVVSEYTHEEAVVDGVNVGYDIYTIETEITKNGAHLEAKEWVDFRSRQSREKRWAQLDEDVDYNAKQLDKDIVNPSTIRNIIKTFQEKLKTDIFPKRTEVPKTLIFAKTDSHADDIIQIIREEFGGGNDFCKKITYNANEDPKSLLAAFRNAYYPRIAVTVDMIATGTDIKPIEVLLFMRDVKSRNYYQQMIGRGTRTIPKDDLRQVTPSASSNKTHFVIVDAIGVCKSLKIDHPPQERKSTVLLKDLMMHIALGSNDEDTFTALANRLTRMEKQISNEERERFIKLSKGSSINQVVRRLLDAYNPDIQIERALKNNPELITKEGTQEPAKEQIEKAKQELYNEASRIFDNPDLRDFIENVRRGYEQIIDTVNLDAVTFTGFDEQAKDRARKIVSDFEALIKSQRDEITALRIFYDQPHRRRELTYRMISELREILLRKKPELNIARVWDAYKLLENPNLQNPISELTALVALVRRVIGIDEQLTLFKSVVDKNFKDWVFEKNAGPKQFTEEQMHWLRMIKDHICASVHMDKDDFDNTPFADHGGLMKAWKIFGDDLEKLVDELNEAMVA
ncbi:MAG: DEAD/DEAH box helicase family protein [Calditrichaceae bacterium]|nr:DEAD/DEAH box helicase family protein [Calditrichaceae bacterium]MBN2707633.1 DEAD/DEAH box helicase family protein [Calditrichaceae bacterium]RQV93197.1 MAG: DEAD/DEAH box helicase [Calditrichota bacterium]